MGNPLIIAFGPREVKIIKEVFPPSAAEGLRASSPFAAVILYAIPGRIRWEESAYPSRDD
jgi:hypothetical protein